MIKSKLIVFFSMVSTGFSVNQIVTCLNLCSHFGAFGNSHFNFNPKKFGVQHSEMLRKIPTEDLEVKNLRESSSRWKPTDDMAKLEAFFST